MAATTKTKGYVLHNQDDTIIGTASTTSGATINMPIGVSPTTPVEGDMWNDTDQMSGSVRFFNGMKQVLSSCIFSQTGDATVGNTTVETTIVGAGDGSLIIPANAMKAGSSMKLTFYGYISTDGGTPTFTIRVKMGSTTIATSVIANMTNALSNVLMNINLIIPVRTLGVTGTIKPIGGIIFDSGVASTSVASMVNTSTVTIDTTIAQTLNITAQWGTANASNTATLSCGVVEISH